MKFKNILTVFAMALLSTSCVTLNGHLDVKQAMSAKKKSGFLNLKTKEIQIQPGLYAAHFKINSDKSYTLKLEGRETILIPLKSKKSLNIPSTGRIFISHNDINQPFDISGEINTDVSESEQQHAIEDCTYVVTENHCKKICESETSCKIECRDVLVEMSGRHEVEFHYQTVNRDLIIGLLKQDKAEELASFHGTASGTSRITDYEGICR